ncbi:TatD family hydrolase [Nitrococcus mobilis]|uniref:Type V secretory pathway protein n=1 Tax=Nitrococcus mobilis Nb-231 TaxID=314278 RepID=A4BQW6_9GAMM|nr:TatD family hydrolase [Nitrococcus mobilis]EAR21966.1 type V secretory pathway protein [Nitrococcus mobilis Nb-231]
MSDACELVDIGVNLTHRRFDRDRDEVIERAIEAGVTTLILTGADPDGSKAALELARQRPELLWSTAGVHPHHAREWSAETTSEIRELAADPRVVAIGETGLDFNRDFSPHSVQERVFTRQLELAVELQRPVFLHQRDAQMRFLAILRDYRDSLAEAVVHCFTGGREELWPYLDLDLYIGITGWLCDERRGGLLQSCVRDIPENRLMIETDAPYLTPRDLEPKPKDGRNEPAFLPHILRRLAQLRGRDTRQLASTTTAVARRFFRLG